MVVLAGGCDFWEWHDDAPTQFLKQLLIDLRDKVRDLTRENTNLRGSISESFSRSSFLHCFDKHICNFTALDTL